MEPAGDVELTHHSAEEARSLLDELCDGYADAYGVESSAEKTSAFRDRATKALERDHFDLVTARAGDTLAGFAFGYSIPARSAWWDNLEPEPSEEFRTETGSRTVLLAELEVRKAWQGKRLGRSLHDEFLSSRREERATLSANPDAVDVQSIYGRWGWEKIGRRSRRPGDYLAAYDLYVLPLAAREGR